MQKSNNNGNKAKPAKKKSDLIDLQHFSIQELLEKAIKAYQEHDNESENRWSSMLAKSGTKKDKISAAGALILEHPQSCLKYFDMMIKWSFDRNHNFAITACEGLASVYSEHIFGDKSTLRDFSDSVQAYIKENKKNCQVSPAELITFYLESEIKQFYSEFIKAIQLLLASDLNHVKKSCVRILGSLAKHKQLRRTVLSLIINKLGDSDMDVVNQVSKCLKDEFYQDLTASQVLMQETERFLFRSNLPQKAQFFVINFLNNINLKYLNQRSINKLFQIFYHFFTKSVTADSEKDKDKGKDKKKKQAEKVEDLGSRLFLNSIKGLNRVFAFMKGGSKETKKTVQEKLEDVYRIVHVTPNIKAKIQLLLFLFQSHVHLHGNISSNNRFYRVLYEFIGKDDVMHTSLSEMFFDLILVCMREDENLSRILAMAKRMLQLCFAANTNFIVTTLLMMDKIIQSKHGLKIVLQKKENAMAQDSDIHEPYDISKRDPLYSGAQKTCLWQLQMFCSHYHPTVRKFAQCLLAGNPIEYEGSNPLLQFNLTSFIEKMSLKKEKKSQAWRIKVKRNLPKIRSSKYTSLLAKDLDSFNEDEEFIKKYLKIRESVHTNSKKNQTHDIEEFADQVIEREMDRLNPREADDDLSITPMEDDEDDDEDDEDAGDFEDGWDQEKGDQGEEEDLEEDDDGMQENEEDMDDENLGDFDDEMDEDMDIEQSGMEDKQFEDVFNEIEDQQQYEGRNKKKSKEGFGKRKIIQKKRNGQKGKGNGYGKGRSNVKQGKTHGKGKQRR